MEETTCELRPLNLDNLVSIPCRNEVRSDNVYLQAYTRLLHQIVDMAPIHCTIFVYQICQKKKSYQSTEFNHAAKF